MIPWTWAAGEEMKKLLQELSVEIREDFFIFFLERMNERSFK